MRLEGRKFRKYNRHSGLEPFIHTRVQLLPRDYLMKKKKDEEKQSYINANFIDGPLGSAGNRKIIACQAPMANTHIAMWRMIS